MLVQPLALASINTDNSTSIPAGCFEFLIDGGSNVNMVYEAPLIAASMPVNVPPLSITGINGPGSQIGAPVVSLTLQPCNSTSDQPIFWPISAGATAQAHRNILAESGLWDLFNASCYKEPYLEIRSYNSSVAMTRRNGLYFILTRLATDNDGVAGSGAGGMHVGGDGMGGMGGGGMGAGGGAALGGGGTAWALVVVAWAAVAWALAVVLAVVACVAAA